MTHPVPSPVPPISAQPVPLACPHSVNLCPAQRYEWDRPTLSRLPDLRSSQGRTGASSCWRTALALYPTRPARLPAKEVSDA